MEIKHCPFCGSEKVSLGSCLEKLYQVECMNCGANGSCVASAKKAVWLWNFALRKESKSIPLNAENPSGLKTLCEKAISKWGEAAQINKAIEELLELAIALTRYQNLNLRDEDYQEKAYKILDNIHEEWEDVEIMLRQLDVIFGRSEEWQRKKYAHLQLIVGDTENE